MAVHQTVSVHGFYDNSSLTKVLVNGTLECQITRVVDPVGITSLCTRLHGDDAEMSLAPPTAGMLNLPGRCVHRAKTTTYAETEYTRVQIKNRFTHIYSNTVTCNQRQ